jgi:uncharacterized protein YkwD
VRVTRQRLLVTIVLFACGCAAPILGDAIAASAARNSATSRHSALRGASADGPHVVSAEVWDLVSRINRHRRALGCAPLAWDERLATLAVRHSRDMSRRDFFDHTNPDGEDPFDRMRRAGIRYRAAAENLAMGARTGDEVFEGWMESRGHRRNLEDCVYTRMGIGLYRDHWTLELARLMGEPRR